MISRRRFCTGVTLSAFLAPAVARATPLPDGGIQGLQARVRAALDRHQSSITVRDRVGIVDFSLPSRQPRFHIMDMMSGVRQTLLVAHGKGSDPDHSGWVEHFSNEPGSEASSAGAYLTGALYEGKHGRSRRLIGLDDSNSNAEARALVIHGAWYVSAAMALEKGKLGRSQGCLAVADNDLDAVLSALAPGCLIYVDKA